MNDAQQVQARFEDYRRWLQDRVSNSRLFRDADGVDHLVMIMRDDSMCYAVMDDDGTCQGIHLLEPDHPQTQYYRNAILTGSDEPYKGEQE